MYVFLVIDLSSSSKIHSFYSKLFNIDLSMILPVYEIIDQSGINMYISDENNTYKYLSKGSLEMLGLDQENWNNLKLEDIGSKINALSDEFEVVHHNNSTVLDGNVFRGIEKYTSPVNNKLIYLYSSKFPTEPINGVKVL